MTLTEENGLRILNPDNLDNVITDVENETMRAEILYLGSSDSIDNYKEINKNTPIILDNDYSLPIFPTDTLAEEQLKKISEVYN
ncbi:MAG: hypothetical protein KHX10_05775 [Clostridium sp.]|nr:hypothetical protein [Clostridium sp.]